MTWKIHRIVQNVKQYKRLWKYRSDFFSFFFFFQKYRTFIKNTRTSILNMKKEKEDIKNSAIAPL